MTVTSARKKSYIALITRLKRDLVKEGDQSRLLGGSGP